MGFRGRALYIMGCEGAPEAFRIHGGGAVVAVSFELGDTVVLYLPTVAILRPSPGIRSRLPRAASMGIRLDDS